MQRQSETLLLACHHCRPPKAPCRHLVLPQGPQVMAPACVRTLKWAAWRRHLMWLRPQAGQLSFLLPLIWRLPPVGLMLDRKL
jgi:hypothetical protein